MGEYVDAGGVKTWFDSWGTGSPLVLLHGGFASNALWEPHTAVLAAHFRVLAPERRGHGHTPDIDGPITYALMAQDTIGFLEAVAGGPAHLVGWSDGGIIALMVAMQRPDLVKKVVAISANFDLSGPSPELLEATPSMSADDPGFAFLRSNYESASPDGPSHWPIVFDKLKQMIMTEPTIDPKELEGIEAPTLVMAADDDFIRLEHTIELYRSIPGAQLAIVPGTSHLLVLEKPDVVTGLVLDFLRNDPTPTMLPIARAPAE